MTQPSGRVLGFPSWHNCALRIALIVRGVSAILTFVEFLYRIYEFHSTKAAFLASLRIDSRMLQIPTKIVIGSVLSSVKTNC
jgi:hypothetical protein